jgi:uncharacterized protein (DUF1330 family)
LRDAWYEVKRVDPAPVQEIGGPKLAAYLIADVEITDPATYEEYKKAVPETISLYGGKFIVRGGKAEKLEGNWDPKRDVVLEFETFEQAMRWWASEEYKGPKALRQSASTANLIVVEGV